MILIKKRKSSNKWKLIDLLFQPQRNFENIKTGARQYKLLNNVLYLNKKLFQFGIISQSKCSFCELYDETPHHIFYECTYAQNLWNRLRLYLSEKVALPVLNPQSPICGFTDVYTTTSFQEIIYFLYSNTIHIIQGSIIDLLFQSQRNFENIKTGARLLYIITIIIIINSVYYYYYYYYYFYQKCYFREKKSDGVGGWFY